MSWWQHLTWIKPFVGASDDKRERLTFKLTRDMREVDAEWRASIENAAVTGQLIMSEQELDAAFAVAVSNKLWSAVLQLLATAEDNAQQEAAGNIDRTNFALGKILEAEGMAKLRAEFIRRRMAGIQGLAQRPQGEKK